ncbi:uncharacterized protein LOC113970043 [Neopelma chrysocephalum]|uniref:uncharacterized protein LOC113970043 n=1 Tax=Neopelma chrysocephalum TaxID=114329 RepID=UPI000FCD12F0|nr:uncharacterized protein LOC113970043 [Neopelma chrysocephalum]
MVGNWEPFHGGSPGSIPRWEPVILPMTEARDVSDGGSLGSIPAWEPRTLSHGGSPGLFPWREPVILPMVGIQDPSHSGSQGPFPMVGAQGPSHSGIPGSLPWCQWPWHGRAGSGTVRIWQEQPVSVPGLQPGKGAAPRAPISFKITKSQAGVPAWGGIFAPSTSAKRDFPSSCLLGHCQGHGEEEGCPWDDPGKDVMVLPQGWTPGMDSVGWIPRLDTVGWIPRAGPCGMDPVGVGGFSTLYNPRLDGFDLQHREGHQTLLDFLIHPCFPRLQAAELAGTPRAGLSPLPPSRPTCCQCPLLFMLPRNSAGIKPFQDTTALVTPVLPPQGVVWEHWAPLREWGGPPGALLGVHKGG